MRIICGCFFIILVGIGNRNLGQNPRQYSTEGALEHRPNLAVVTANDPRPLWQAVAAIRDEYGWVVDFEDPPFQNDSDFVDNATPEWRANHPNVKGFRIPAGGRFQSEYPERPESYASSSPDIDAVLGKIISDYNQSGNPGKFSIRRQSDGSYAVIGQSIRDSQGKDKAVGSLLDTPVSIPVGPRDATQAILTILKTLSANTGVQVIPGAMPINSFKKVQVNVGGQQVSARLLLLQVISATHHKVVWDLLCGDGQTCALNVAPAMRAVYDTFGHKTTIPIQ
jgi:hypothetical protein